MQNKFQESAITVGEAGWEAFCRNQVWGDKNAEERSGWWAYKMAFISNLAHSENQKGFLKASLYMFTPHFEYNSSGMDTWKCVKMNKPLSYFIHSHRVSQIYVIVVISWHMDFFF